MNVRDLNLSYAANKHLHSLISYVTDGVTNVAANDDGETNTTDWIIDIREQLLDECDDTQNPRATAKIIITDISAFRVLINKGNQDSTERYHEIMNCFKHYEEGPRPYFTQAYSERFRDYIQSHGDDVFEEFKTCLSEIEEAYRKKSTLIFQAHRGEYGLQALKADFVSNLLSDFNSIREPRSEESFHIPDGINSLADYIEAKLDLWTNDPGVPRSILNNRAKALSQPGITQALSNFSTTSWTEKGLLQSEHKVKKLMQFP